MRQEKTPAPGEKPSAGKALPYIRWTTESGVVGLNCAFYRNMLVKIPDAKRLVVPLYGVQPSDPSAKTIVMFAFRDAAFALELQGVIQGSTQ